MNWLSKLLGGAGVALVKAGMTFSGWPNSPIFRLPGLPEERDYGRLIGDGSQSSIVQACIQWICRTFPEAPPAMWQLDADDVRIRIRRHPMVRLLRFPTAGPGLPGGHYSGVHLWMATLTSRVVDGNAYWLKVRSAVGRPVQLWYVPHWMLEPRWPTDGSTYISHYDYKINGQIIRIEPSEIIHFRDGLDPDNPRKGKSPLSTLLREIFTDEEAARFSASLLKNLGIPGLLISPAAVANSVWRAQSDDVQMVKERFKQDFGGDLRGEPLVMSGPTSLQQFGFSPQDLNLEMLRHIPEERVSAVLGIPAAVIGLGAGIRHTKVGATMAELRDQAWQSHLIPTQRIISEEIAAQLLPDFTTDLEGNEFGFDNSRVKVLQEDQGKVAERWARLVSAGIAKRREARVIFDLPIGPEDDIYIPQPGVQQTAPIQAEEGLDAAALQRQVDDLQSQLDDQKAATVAAKGEAQVKSLQGELDHLKERLKEFAKAPAAPQQITVNVPERQAITNVTVPERQAVNNVTVPERQLVNNVNVPERQAITNVDATTKVEPGAVSVKVEASKQSGVVIERDIQGRVTGAKPNG